MTEEELDLGPDCIKEDPFEYWTSYMEMKAQQQEDEHQEAEHQEAEQQEAEKP